MERQHVIDVIVKHVKNSVETSIGNVDPTRPMTEYGVSSLDTVEITAAVMRELKVNVPRTDIARAKSLNDLADLFLRVGGAMK
jgi:acyl carrier protein